jgi:hypothetical protein
MISIEGRLVARKNEGMKPIKMWQASYITGQGIWLTMGNDYPDDAKDTIDSEQNAVGLISALLLTVNTAYLQGVDVEYFTESGGWLGVFGGDDWEKIAYNLAYGCNLVGFAFTLLATIHSIFVMLVSYQMTGPVEASMLVGKMGLRLSFGFFYFLLGLIITAVGLIIHIVTMFTEFFWVPTFFGLVLGLPVCIWVFSALFPLVYTMYFVKSQSYANAPMHLDMEEIEQYVAELIEKVGTSQLTENLVNEYIKERFACKDAAVPVTFTEVTKQCILGLTDKLIEMQVEAALEKSTLLEKMGKGELAEVVVESTLKQLAETSGPSPRKEYTGREPLATSSGI